MASGKKSSQELSQASSQGASIQPGTYDRVIVFDSSEAQPFMQFDIDFKDINGHSFDDLFKFTVSRKLSDKNRLFRRPVETADGVNQLSIFCRIQDSKLPIILRTRTDSRTNQLISEVTPKRLQHELAELNKHMAKCSDEIERISLYPRMVDVFFEKMVMDLTYPPRDALLNKWIWKKYDSVNLRRTIVDMPRTEDEVVRQSEEIIHRLLREKDSATEPRMTRSQSTLEADILASTAASYKRQPTIIPGTSADMFKTSFKPPKKKTDEPKPAKTTIRAVAEIHSRPSSRSSSRARSRTPSHAASEVPSRAASEAPSHAASEASSRAASEAPSTVASEALMRRDSESSAIQENIGKERETWSKGIDEVKKMLVDTMNLIYDEARRAAKDENGEALNEIKKDIEDLKKSVQKMDSKITSLFSVTQKSSKGSKDFSAEIARIMEGQAKIEKKLHNLGYTMAEKEAIAMKIITRVFPIDRLNPAVDVFLQNSFVQEMVLKYLKPSIDGVSYQDLDKGVANAILTKLFTQNCRAHMVVGDTQQGLTNKMWCKRQMPNFCISIIDSLVIPYLSKKLKGGAKDHIIAKNVAEVTSRMQVTLCGDRTAFIKRAGYACKTVHEAVTAMYEEDCRFYDDNRHLIHDDKPTFEQYFEANKGKPNLKLGEQEERQSKEKESKKKVYPQPGHVFDTMKLREGLELTSIKDAVELIATAYSSMGGDIDKLYFDPMRSIPDMKKQTREAIKEIKANMGDVVEKWFNQQRFDQTTETRTDDQIGSEDEFVTPAKTTKKRRGTSATSSRSIKKARSSGKAVEPNMNPDESGTSSAKSTTTNSHTDETPTPSPPPKRERTKKKTKEDKPYPKRNLFIRESDEEREQEEEEQAPTEMETNEPENTDKDQEEIQMEHSESEQESGNLQDENEPVGEENNPPAVEEMPDSDEGEQEQEMQN